MGTIGYYVHHHGDGHRQRALQIANIAPDNFVLLGTGLKGRTGQVRCLELPDDRLNPGTDFDGFDDVSERPNALHYAPVHHAGVRNRVALITSWIAREQPALMVVDVSAEVALLARLAATPTVYVRLCGRRNDPAHLDAFRGASQLLAPFHAGLDDAATPDWVLAKTQYFGGFASPCPIEPASGQTALVVKGKGGGLADGNALADAARATPSWQWRVAGPVSPPDVPAVNLTLLGWVDDVKGEVSRASVVVGAAGDGLVAQMAAVPRPFICLPEARPFGEQQVKAERLRALGAALVLDAWPDPSRWDTLFSAAQTLGTRRLGQLHVKDGPARAATFLLDAAQISANYVSPEIRT